MNNTDIQYQSLLKLVLGKGKRKKNRTGTDTFGVFGAQARFDLQEGFPLLTTKKVFAKGIIHELLWFLKGDTNIKYLVDNDVHIWNGDAYRKYKNTPTDLVGYAGLKSDDNGRGVCHYSKEEFIEKIKNDADFAGKWGDLGQGTYGQMWKAFPYYKENPFEGMPDDFAESPSYSDFEGRVDQIKKAIDKLKTNPDDRRIIVSAWHPYWVDHCALPPCHVLFHFNTEELDAAERWALLLKKRGLASIHTPKPMNVEDSLKWCEEECDKEFIPKRRLNCLFYCRSQDLPLGTPFNWASYALLLSMVAQVVNMVPGELIWTAGDVHIYENQIEGIKEQLNRQPKALPRLKLNPDITDLFDFKFEDIEIIDYDPHPAIKMPVSTG